MLLPNPSLPVAARTGQCNGYLRRSGHHNEASKRGIHLQRGKQRLVVRAALPGQEQVKGGLRVLEWTGGLIPQGALVKGAKTGWRLAWETFMRELAPQTKSGSYKRPSYTFRGRIGDAQFPVESGRYHVYVGNACPWCHRVLLALVLRGLPPHISITPLTDDAERASRGGWVCDTTEPLVGAKDLREVYEAASPGYTGRCTAPLLVDKKTKRVVSNESSDIVRMLNDVQLPGSFPVDLYPHHLQPEIDRLNDFIYNKVNNGVYACGFATSQSAYESAATELFSALDTLDSMLSEKRFLTGGMFTEADLRLFPTLVRFDAVYATLFKCSGRRIAEYPHLSAWLRDVHNIRVGEGAPDSMQVCDTFDVDSARRSYFGQLFPLNPGGIIPIGPTAKDLAFSAPANRGSTKFEDIFHLRDTSVTAPLAA